MADKRKRDKLAICSGSDAEGHVIIEGVMRATSGVARESSKTGDLPVIEAAEMNADGELFRRYSFGIMNPETGEVRTLTDDELAERYPSDPAAI